MAFYRAVIALPSVVSKGAEISVQYHMTGTSGLEFEVAPGKNKINIPLE